MILFLIPFPFAPFFLANFSTGTRLGGLEGGHEMLGERSSGECLVLGDRSRHTFPGADEIRRAQQKRRNSDWSPYVDTPFLKWIPGRLTKRKVDLGER